MQGSFFFFLNRNFHSLFYVAALNVPREIQIPVNICILLNILVASLYNAAYFADSSHGSCTC
jgi:hypothetical protein